VRTCSSIFDRILDVLAWIGAGLLGLLMLAVCYDIASRYLLNAPVRGLIEFGQYAMLYSTFLGAAWLLRKEGHVKIDLLTTRLKPDMQARMEMVTSIICLLISVILVVFGTEVVFDHFKRGVRDTTELALLKAPFIAIIPFGSLLLALQFVRRALNYKKQIESHRVRKTNDDEKRR